MSPHLAWSDNRLSSMLWPLFLFSYFTRPLCTHRHAGGALEFAPTNPSTFDGAQDCFPDAVTKHRPIDQAHWQNAPGAQDWLASKNTRERGQQHVHRKECDDEGHH